MSCNCKFYQRRLEKLQRKYTMLKKNHKKLLEIKRKPWAQVEGNAVKVAHNGAQGDDQAEHDLRLSEQIIVLLGVTVLLTEALEEFVKGEVKSEINDTLSNCSSIYPDLFSGESHETHEGGDLKTQSDDQCIQENEKMFETATESEKEYYEGFMARPKIPRTPQV